MNQKADCQNLVSGDAPWRGQEVRDRRQWPPGRLMQLAAERRGAPNRAVARRASPLPPLRMRASCSSQGTGLAHAAGAAGCGCHWTECSSLACSLQPMDGRLSLEQGVRVGHVARKGGQELGGHLAVVHAVVGCRREGGGNDKDTNVRTAASPHQQL